MIQNIPHRVSNLVEAVLWQRMAADGPGSPVFIYDGAAERSCKINSKVCRSILSIHIPPNATKLIGQYFKVQMENDPIFQGGKCKEPHNKGNKGAMFLILKL